MSLILIDFLIIVPCCIYLFIFLEDFAKFG